MQSLLFPFLLHLDCFDLRICWENDRKDLNLFAISEHDLQEPFNNLH